jgi:hypothetical protein
VIFPVFVRCAFYIGICSWLAKTNSRLIVAKNWIGTSTNQIRNTQLGGRKPTERDRDASTQIKHSWKTKAVVHCRWCFDEIRFRNVGLMHRQEAPDSVSTSMTAPSLMDSLAKHYVCSDVAIVRLIYPRWPHFITTYSNYWPDLEHNGRPSAIRKADTCWLPGPHSIKTASHERSPTSSNSLLVPKELRSCHNAIWSLGMQSCLAQYIRSWYTFQITFEENQSLLVQYLLVRTETVDFVSTFS